MPPGSAFVLTVFLMAGAPAPLGAPPHPVSELLGQWRGPSICEKADWNAACHDEDALYEFVLAPARGHALLYAYKIVNDTRPQLMGDLDVSYDARLHAWTGEFQNARVHLRWLFEVDASAVEGRMEQFPSMRVARRMRLSRVRTVFHTEEVH